MIGQKNLLSKLNNFTTGTLPHSMLFIGECGSEEESIFSFLSSKFNLNVIQVECINSEIVDIILDSKDPTLYTIKADGISDREQNILLKTFEEPNTMSYIAIYSETIDKIIDTIKTRSYVFKFDTYLVSDLLKIANNDVIPKFCSTPGQVEVANRTDMSKLIKLCNDILSKMSLARYSDVLKISNKINFKDEYDKFDLHLFIRILEYTAIKQDKLNIYKYILNMKNRIFYVNNKKQLFENFLTNIWLELK